MIAGRLRWRAGVAPLPIPKKIGLLSLSLRPRDSPSHRGEPEEARVGARRLRPRRARSPRPRRPRAARGVARGVRRAPAQREPHAEARAHGPDALLGDRERVLGRDPARREALSRRAHVAPDGRRGRRASSTRRERPSSSGPTACGATPERRFRKRSRRSARTWPCTGSSASRVPRCGTAVQRIVYAANETNYCPACQTGGRLLADRSLSRLLHGDWPKSLEEMEERMKNEKIS